MKKVSFIIMLGIAVAAVAAVSPISWKTTSLDLGEVKAGVSKDLEFELHIISFFNHTLDQEHTYTAEPPGPLNHPDR